MTFDTRDEAESEYEYEYSQTETESFFIDVDLSSVNNVLKSQNAGERKSLKAPATRAGQGADADDQERDAGDEDNEAEHEEEDAGDLLQAPAGKGSPPQLLEAGVIDVLDTSADSIQILELESTSPLILYRNQVYNCQWTDMVGTNMFFTKHNETPMQEPEIATEDYDLIGTTRIKLVGHRAKILPKTESSAISNNKRPRNDANNVDSPLEMDDNEDDNGYVFEGNSEPGVAAFLPSTRDQNSYKRTTTRALIDNSRQATFLEKLRTIKRQRGENDTVRKFVDRHLIEADQRQRDQKEKTRKEIDRLNKRVVKGDTKALKRLQEIYADIEDVEESDDAAPSERRGTDQET